MRLTKRNYFSKTNNYLSASKIKDFQRDKNYFFHKYILKDLPYEKKGEPLIIGSAVDEWLTQGEDKFRDKYTLVSRRDTNDEFQLNPTQYKKVEDICKKVSSISAYKQLKGFKRQVILQFEEPIGEHFEGCCGMIDFLKVRGDWAGIVDLKTSNNVNPDKWFWTCEQYKYFQQLAMYGHLVMKNNPAVKHINYRHLVVDTSDDLYPVYAFEIDFDYMNRAIIDLKDEIEDIKNEKKFLPKDADWTNAYVVGRE